jgi:DNA ligase-associated metallophosphoesterase
MSRAEDPSATAAAERTPATLGLTLLPQRAVFDRTHGALFVADVHLGKAASFRARGVPAPGGTTRDNLERLSLLLDETGAERLIVLGDLFHAREGLTKTLIETIDAWRDEWRRVHIILVAGNHDRHAGAALQALDIEVAVEPFAHCGVEGRHHPLSAAQAFEEGPVTLVGHMHPVARLHGPGRDRLRLPCFFRQGRQLILPAFGAFTGGWEINGEKGSEAFAICEDRVVPLTTVARA